MSALGVVMRAIMHLAQHPLTKRVFKAAMAAALAEIIRHAQLHMA